VSDEELAKIGGVSAEELEEISGSGSVGRKNEGEGTGSSTTSARTRSVSRRVVSDDEEERNQVDEALES